MVFYIHGFNSMATGSQKITKFSTYLGATVIPLDYESCDFYQNNIDKMSKVINKFKDEQHIFIGTSLGGFYAAHLATIFNGISIMLNPAINPAKTLHKYIGENINYTTLVPCILLKEHIASYPQINIPEKSLFLLNEGDEVISSLDTIDFINNKHKYILFSGGTHRFESVEEASSNILDYLDIS